jgi:acyl carrier protein
METEALEQQIKQIIANTAGIDLADIDEKTSFVDDLDLDSLTLLEIAVNVDYEYDLKLSEDEMGEIGTLGGAVALVQKRMALQAE